MTNINQQHYNKIHKRVFLYEWDNLNDKLRLIIANDIDGKSYALRAFNRIVEGETARLYWDPEYYYNNEI